MAISRLRLKDMLESELTGSASVGICVGDVSSVARVVNRAQERLLTCREAGDTGWWGGYAEIALTATQNDPYITLPRGAARLIRIDACNYPVRIENQFYEYLDFGSGRWPKLGCDDTTVCASAPSMGFRRNTACTFSDLTTPNKSLRIYLGNSADVGKRVLVGGTDSNSQTLYSTSNGIAVPGLFATLASPFVDLKLSGSAIAVELGSINSIQKDATIGQVRFYEVDITTGAQRLILTMEPGETVASYARYYLGGLPDGCCQVAGTAPGSNIVSLTAMVKLDLIPAKVDSDYLLIQSREALICECQSARFGDMDSDSAKAQSAERHRQSVRHLQGQLVHEEGKEDPAINFAPFGSARLINQRIGALM